jgi:hypothetical protein
VAVRPSSVTAAAKRALVFATSKTMCWIGRIGNTDLETSLLYVPTFERMKGWSVDWRENSERVVLTELAMYSMVLF